LKIIRVSIFLGSETSQRGQNNTVFKLISTKLQGGQKSRVGHFLVLYNEIKYRRE
jgi:hypothetical protein